MTPDELGRLAESKVRSWASEVGIIATRPEEDRKGWDLLLEFPGLPSQSEYFFDTAPPELSVKVQVKGTTKPNEGISIKLDNLSRFAKEPMPCFFIIVIFAPPPQDVGAFLVHVDGEFVARIMKRLREVTVGRDPGATRRTSDDPPRLHKIKLNLTWDEEHRIERTGQGLADAIKAHVGNTRDYFHEKIQWWQNAGNTRRMLTISVPPSYSSGEASEMLADLAVGLQDEIPIFVEGSREYRFDIPRDNTRVPTGEYRLSLPDRTPLAATTLTISALGESGIRHSVSYPVRIYSSVHMFPFLLQRHWKLRFVGRSLSILAETEPARVKLAFTPSADEQFTIGELGAAARVLLMTSGTDGEFSIAFRLHGDLLRVDYIREPLDSSLLQDLFVFHWLLDICNRWGLPEETVVETQAIRAQEPDIMFMAAAMEGVSVSMKVPANPADPFWLSDEENIQLLPILLRRIRVSDVFLFAIVGIAAETQAVSRESDGTYELSGPVMVKRTRIVRVSDWERWMTEEYPVIMQALTEESSAQGIELLLPVGENRINIMPKP